jgi:release factor glutamine methyltransferase
MVLHELIAAGRRRLVSAGFIPADAAFDAGVLARHVLGWDAARLLGHDRDPPPSGFAAAFAAAIERRSRHEPVAYIVGSREFWGRDFLVTPATLVPRPETELIVEQALELLPDRPGWIVDVGTGSGCLAVSLAIERPAAQVIATDVSHAALLVARENARRYHVASRTRFVQADLATGFAVRAELIVSNPPYVPESRASTLPDDVLHYEPVTALFGGDDGLSMFRRLFATAPPLLADGGTLIVEFGFEQDTAVRMIAEAEGWRVCRVVNDLQGIPRTIVLTRST